ncbi:MAG: plasmid pRiA4b ORF-3 family protein [Deltaproteobacteria bacterium]|nr:plasmid pRiA4b ORF-3 family protein [Deltaproteobacteria bacterium]
MKKPTVQLPFYSFRIELKGIKPKIWRYFYTPANISLVRFHNVIQEVMGWSNYHLYSFTIHKEEYFDDPEGDDAFMDMFPSARHVTHSGLSKFRLDRLALLKGTQFSYLYDMGDSWEHVIKVLDTDYLPQNPKQKYGCFKGERACPPEDCGGIYGYCDLLETLADPESDEHEDMMEWTGGGVDPEEFDLEDINARLRHLK